MDHSAVSRQNCNFELEYGIHSIQNYFRAHGYTGKFGAQFKVPIPKWINIFHIPDIRQRVLQSIDCGSIYKVWRSLDKTFHKECLPIRVGEIRFANGILTLVQKGLRGSSSSSWDWREISRNPTITWDLIQKYREKYPWSYAYISANPNITWEYVMSLPDKAWDKCELARNPGITWDVISEHFLSESCYHQAISANPNITWEIVKRNPQVNWFWPYLSKNPGIGIGDIEANLDRPWDWAEVSLHPNLTWDFIHAHRDKQWDSNELLKRRCITFEVYTEYLLPLYHDQNHLKFFTANPNISQEWMRMAIKAGIGDHICSVARNPSLEVELIRSHGGGLMELWYSHYANLNWRDVWDNQDVCWDLSGLSRNTFRRRNI